MEWVWNIVKKKEKKKYAAQCKHEKCNLSHDVVCRWCCAERRCVMNQNVEILSSLAERVLLWSMQCNVSFFCLWKRDPFNFVPACFPCLSCSFVCACSHGCFCVDEECVLPVTLAVQMCVWSAAPLCVSWCVFECLSSFWSDCLFLSVSDRWRPTDTELLSWMFQPVSPLSRRVSAALPSAPSPSSLCLSISPAGSVFGITSSSPPHRSQYV